jgi:hypothetical protein
VTAVEKFDVPTVGSRWRIGGVLCLWNGICYEMQLYNVGRIKEVVSILEEFLCIGT